MLTLKQLIEAAKAIEEDGTVADLGPVPTGHKRLEDDTFNILKVNSDEKEDDK